MKTSEVVFTLLKKAMWVGGSVEEGFTGDACLIAERTESTQQTWKTTSPSSAGCGRKAIVVIPWKPARGEAKHERPNPSSEQGRSQYMQPEGGKKHFNHEFDGREGRIARSTGHQR